MTFFTSTYPVARKPHQCWLCCRLIEPGEKYRLGVTFDSGVFKYKECLHCNVLVTIPHRESGDYEYGDTIIIDWKPRTIPEARCRAQWKRKWRDRNGNLYPVPEFVYVEGRYGFSRPVSVKPGDFNQPQSGSVLSVAS